LEEKTSTRLIGYVFTGVGELEIRMNNKTFEIVEKTIVSLESCLETDKSLQPYDTSRINRALDYLKEVYEETTKQSNPA
jgi:hypothetical protein